MTHTARGPDLLVGSWPSGWKSWDLEHTRLKDSLSHCSRWINREGGAQNSREVEKTTEDSIRRVGGGCRCGYWGCRWSCSGNGPVSSAYRLGCRVTFSLIGNCQPYGNTWDRRGIVEVLGVLSKLAIEQMQTALLVGMKSEVRLPSRCWVEGRMTSAAPERAELC